jgi:dipeptidyl aminopeptidase/acylaminoacyl peptidase
MTVIVVAMAAAACSGDSSAPAETPAARPSERAATAAAAATATPLPPTPTPLPPTPSPTPAHPLSIEFMRNQAYPGSDLVIEQTLAPGSNYDRYVASYLSEGLKINALLTVPRGEAPPTGWPVIIFNHGYIPPAQYRTTERYVAYVDAFAKNGYIVLKSDYRGHGSSEGDPEGGYGSPAYTIDVLNAVATMRRYRDADPDRLGMWGHSMGGSITLRSMVVTDTVKAGVIWAGVVASYPDLFARWHRREGASIEATPRPRGRWRTQLFESYGSPGDNPDFWASISPPSYLADISGPIQLHHGTADHSVPVEFSEELHQKLLDAGQSSELYLYEGNDHNIAASLSTALNRSVAFFDQHVKEARAE